MRLGHYCSLKGEAARGDMTKKVVKYGSWKSPITSDLIVTGTIGLGDIAFDGRQKEL